MRDVEAKFCFDLSCFDLCLLLPPIWKDKNYHTAKQNKQKMERKNGKKKKKFREGLRSGKKCINIHADEGRNQLDKALIIPLQASPKTN